MKEIFMMKGARKLVDVCGNVQPGGLHATRMKHICGTTKKESKG